MFTVINNNNNNKGQLEPSQNRSEKYLSNIPGKQEIKETQKPAIIWHCTHTSERANLRSAKHIQVHRLLHQLNA